MSKAMFFFFMDGFMCFTSGLKKIKAAEEYLTFCFIAQLNVVTVESQSSYREYLWLLLTPLPPHPEIGSLLAGCRVSQIE